MANNIRGHTASYICALADDGSNQILPAEIDPATGELKVQATFTGVLVVAIDEATDSIQIWGNDGPNGSGTNRFVYTDSDGRIRTTSEHDEDTPHVTGDEGAFVLSRGTPGRYRWRLLPAYD
jgi:hypothetical protein